MSYPYIPQDPPKKRMPWYGWGCLGLAGMFTLLLLALIVAAVLMPPADTDPEPDPVETSQPPPDPEPTQEPEPEPDPSPTFEELDTDEETNDDVVEEAGGDRAYRNLNAAADDPTQRGDEEAYLNHVMDMDRSVYETTQNSVLLEMGQTVCSALDEGFTVDDILTMMPDSLSVNTQATFVAGSAMFLCEEHREAVAQEVGAAGAV